jgi:hypothetical protein
MKYKEIKVLLSSTVSKKRVVEKINDIMKLSDIDDIAVAMDDFRKELLKYPVMRI